MSENMLPDEKIYCHLTGFKSKCRDMVVGKGCRKWVRVTGQHPTEDRKVDFYDCADQWEIALRHEQFRIGKTNADAIDRMAKSVDSLRGVIVALDNAKLEAANGILHAIAKHIPALQGLNEVEVRGRPHLDVQIEHKPS